MPSDTTVSTTEAGEIIGISRIRVWRLIQDERIEAVKIGPVWRIERTEAIRYRDRRLDRILDRNRKRQR